jgi:hypothetical protein
MTAAEARVLTETCIYADKIARTDTLDALKNRALEAIRKHASGGVSVVDFSPSTSPFTAQVATWLMNLGYDVKSVAKDGGIKLTVKW